MFFSCHALRGNSRHDHALGILNLASRPSSAFSTEVSSHASLSQPGSL